MDRIQWYTIYITQDGKEKVYYDANTNFKTIQNWIKKCGSIFDRVRIFKGKNIGKLVLDTK